LRQSDARYQAKIRAAARRDSAIFARVWRHLRPGGHQFDMARRVDDEQLHYQADFWPRDHGKSEIFCIAYPLRRICEDPNTRVLIVQKTQVAAVKTLQVIKDELEKNRELKTYYRKHWRTTVGVPDISNAQGAVDRDGRKESAWQQQRIYCKRTRRGKDPTVEAVGVGGAITGGHFDIIILDDVEDDENVRTPERLKALLGWFIGTIMQLREPTTKIVIVGTLKTAAADIYNFVRTNPLWDCHLVSAITSHRLSDIEYELLRNDRGVVTDVQVKTPGVTTLWPEKWSIQALLLEMAASIRSIWVREKLNDLSEMAGAIFWRTWWQGKARYRLDEAQAVVGRYLSVDSALTDNSESDFTAIGIWEVLASYQIRLRWLTVERWMFPALAAGIVTVAAQWQANLLGVLIEDRGSGTSVLQTLRSSAPDWLKDKLIAFMPQGSKEKRAQQASLWCEKGAVLLPYPDERLPWLFEFEETLYSFPAVAHDDVVDQLSQMVLYLENYLAAWYASQGGAQA
jgi:predicted phage terminase large subunit-like protein